MVQFLPDPDAPVLRVIAERGFVVECNVAPDRRSSELLVDVAGQRVRVLVPELIRLDRGRYVRIVGVLEPVTVDLVVRSVRVEPLQAMRTDFVAP